MARVTKAPEERKQEIIEAAFELFSEKGYEQTTIQDIASHIHVAQGLCYRYFKSKQELFNATADFYAQQTVAYMQGGVDPSANAVDKFNTVLKNVFIYAIQHSEYEAAYRSDLDVFSNRINQVGNNISNVIIPIIRQGVNEGTFYCENIEDTVKFATFGIINLLHVDINQENAQECFRSRLASIAEICRNILRAPDCEIGAGWNEI